MTTAPILLLISLLSCGSDCGEYADTSWVVPIHRDSESTDTGLSRAEGLDCREICLDDPLQEPRYVHDCWFRTEGGLSAECEGEALVICE
jgi:hypothetical protein